MTEILCLLLQLYLVVCMVRIVFSWLPIQSGGILETVQSVTYNLTEPLFEPVRRVLPRPGDIPIDFAPMIVIFGIILLRGIVCSMG